MEEPQVDQENNLAAHPSPQRDPSDARSGEEDKAEDLIAVLFCSTCQNPFLSAPQIIAEKASVWSDQVYSYELDVVDQVVWCYSATNPTAHRFDVLRVLPSAAEAPTAENRLLLGGLQCRGNPSTEHTWFPGYGWSFCTCVSCGKHMGWGYTKVGEIQISFLGIILTGTAPRHMPRGEFEALCASAVERRAAHDAYQVCRQRFVSRLRSMGNQVVAHMIANIITEMDQSPTRRDLRVLRMLLTQVGGEGGGTAGEGESENDEEDEDEWEDTEEDG